MLEHCLGIAGALFEHCSGIHVRRPRKNARSSNPQSKLGQGSHNVRAMIAIGPGEQKTKKC
jgi:hypothetical protein